MGIGQSLVLTFFQKCCDLLPTEGCRQCSCTGPGCQHWHAQLPALLRGQAPKVMRESKRRRKKPKSWKKAGGEKSLKLKCLRQFPNYGERCSCLHNPFQSQGSTKSQASFPTPPSAPARPDQFSQHLTKQIYPREQFFQHAGKKIWQRLWTASAIKTLWGLSFIGKIFL